VPRAGLSTAAVIERAAQLLDEQGPESLNLAGVAVSFGVKIPSLYKHVDGVRGLQRGIMLSAKSDLTTVIEQAAVGCARDDDAVDATRFLRSALHGFVSLETGGAFELPVDRERSFSKLVESVVTALAAWGSPVE